MKNRGCNSYSLSCQQQHKQLPIWSDYPDSAAAMIILSFPFIYLIQENSPPIKEMDVVAKKCSGEKWPHSRNLEGWNRQAFRFLQMDERTDWEDGKDEKRFIADISHEWEHHRTSIMDLSKELWTASLNRRIIGSIWFWFREKQNVWSANSVF